MLSEEIPSRTDPYGFNAGFVGLISEESIAAVRSESVNLAFVIDDLHFGIPEPGTLVQLVLGGVGAMKRRR